MCNEATTRPVEPVPYLVDSRLYTMYRTVDPRARPPCGAASPWSPSVTRFDPVGPLDCTTQVLRPVACTRTPKPAKFRSQNAVSFSSTVSASTVRLVIRSSLRRGTVVSRRHSRCRRALEICSQTAYDGHQIGAYRRAESTVMQGLLGGIVENYFNITSRLANRGVLGTSAAYVESSDILFSPIHGGGRGSAGCA